MNAAAPSWRWCCSSWPRWSSATAAAGPTRGRPAGSTDVHDRDADRVGAGLRAATDRCHGGATLKAQILAAMSATDRRRRPSSSTGS